MGCPWDIGVLYCTVRLCGTWDGSVLSMACSQIYVLGGMVVQSPGTALDVATLTANPGPGSEPLKLWLKVLSELQYMDTVSGARNCYCRTREHFDICRTWVNMSYVLRIHRGATKGTSFILVAPTFYYLLSKRSDFFFSTANKFFGLDSDYYVQLC